MSVLCKERGALLLEVWQAHATLLRTVHAKLQVSCRASAALLTVVALCERPWAHISIPAGASGTERDGQSGAQCPPLSGLWQVLWFVRHNTVSQTERNVVLARVMLLDATVTRAQFCP